MPTTTNRTGYVIILRGLPPTLLCPPRDPNKQYGSTAYVRDALCFATRADAENLMNAWRIPNAFVEDIRQCH